jgi:DNA-binding transcriptional LysR family regulator
MAAFGCSLRLDLAVIGIAEDESELHITRLNQHQVYFVVRSGHALVASKEVPTLQSVLRFPLVTTSRISGPIPKQFLAGGLGDGPDHFTKSFPSITCESIAMMKTIAAETDTVGLLPLNAVMAEVRAGQLVVLSLAPPFLKVDWGIVRLSHRSLSRLGETFVRLLLEVDAELLDFEQKKVLVAPRRNRSRPRSATSAR